MYNKGNTENIVNSNINWDDVIKKEARGLDDEDLGEVHEVGSDMFYTERYNAQG